jgi:hypothetical protein
MPVGRQQTRRIITSHRQDKCNKKDNESQDKNKISYDKNDKDSKLINL